MHNEIESIVKKHDQKHTEEINRAKTFSGFLGEKNTVLYLVNWVGVVPLLIFNFFDLFSFPSTTDFLGKHKTNISVIVVSFLTVILSVKMVRNLHAAQGSFVTIVTTLHNIWYTIINFYRTNLTMHYVPQVQIKQQYKELEKKLINTQGQVDQKRNLLKAVTDQSFVAQVASHCAKESEQNQSKSWFRTSSNKENIQTIVSSVLQQELDHLIGDEALTEEEKNAKRFKELQASSSNKSSSVEQQDVKLSGLLAEQSKVNEGEEVELVTDANGKVIKKSVFRI